MQVLECIKALKALARWGLLMVIAAGLAACAGSKQVGAPKKKVPAATVRVPAGGGQEVVMHALGLIDVGYTFGGSNPEAGLDCSGLVRFVYQQALGLALPHNAAQMATLARFVNKGELQPGDLVFFNTLGRPRSHVGIYIGNDQFIHAPNSRGKVRIESLSHPYYLSRFEGGGSFLN